MITAHNTGASGSFPTLSRNREISEKQEDPNETLSPIQTVPERDPPSLKCHKQTCSLLGQKTKMS